MISGLERVEPVRHVGSFLFGAVAYVGFTAIPIYFGPRIVAVIPSTIASVLLFLMFALLAVLFLQVMGTAPGRFLLTAAGGGTLPFLVDAIRWNSSPVLPLLYVSFLGTLVVGSLSHIALTSWVTQSESS